MAIVIRSSDYAQEWTGDFTVSNEDGSVGNMHAGFKAARDEVLRYAAQYMKNHGITGDLKIWIAGHSRGAVISNLLGASLRAEAMTRLAGHGYRIVAHVHDEVIIEAPADAKLDTVCEIMGRTPEWIRGLELRADGFERSFIGSEKRAATPGWRAARVS